MHIFLYGGLYTESCHFKPLGKKSVKLNSANVPLPLSKSLSEDRSSVFAKRRSDIPAEEPDQIP